LDITLRPLRRFTLIPVLALIAGLLIVFAPSPAQAADKDCGDFATQKAAQIFFLNHGGPSSDPHGLDGEGDGVVCESNPCTCYYGTQLPGGQPSTGGGKTLRQNAKVIKVIDGDTIDVRLANGYKRRVRLIGIDTPEVYGGVECGGRRASRSAKRLLPRGTRVTLVSDPTQDRKDRYNRILRCVIRNKGAKDINRAQIWRGMATVYVYDNTPFKRTANYRKAQRSAKANNRGIWGTCR
jgi:endonuclease YncB( thermonuclease family)